MKRVLSAACLALAAVLAGAGQATPVAAHFDSTGADRAAIQTLLDTYTSAVSTKDQALFETLLLAHDIPFSGIGPVVQPGAGLHTVQNYDDFRRGVFAGPAFTQRFQDVHVQQDGPLASVSLVFVNTAADGASWGWKTLQLLKVGATWKIASELYTSHRGQPPGVRPAS